MYELLSLVLAVPHSFSVLRLLPAGALKTITRVVLPWDSTIIAIFFNPRVRLTSVLVRNAVFQVKSVARDIINICPQATVHLTWIEGAINPSYLNSKLHLRPIMAGNSNMYSYGPTIYLDEAQLIANTYLRIDGKGIYYFPLPLKRGGVVPGQENEGPGRQTANTAQGDRLVRCLIRLVRLPLRVSLLTMQIVFPLVMTAQYVRRYVNPCLQVNLLTLQTIWFRTAATCCWKLRRT